MKIFAAIMLFLASSPVLALTCKNDYAGTAGCAANSSAAGDCETLGYGTADVEGCEHYLYCPFNSSYKRCVRSKDKLCTELGFSQTDKSKWCANIISCESDPSYTLCEMQKQRCIIGDVFFADGTCSSVDDYDGKKTPIGVVFYVDESLYSGKIVNLKDLRTDENFIFHPESPYEGVNDMPFGLYYMDGGTYSWKNGDSLINAFATNDSKLYAGKENTRKMASITQFFSPNTAQCMTPGTAAYNQYCQPTAALAALAFYPAESVKSNPRFGSGNWYVPAIGELVQLYGVSINSLLVGANSGLTDTPRDGPTKSLIENVLTKLKAKGVEADKLTLKKSYYDMKGEYISSTESIRELYYGDLDYALWIMDWYSSRMMNNRARGTYYMRVIAEY